VRALLIVLDGFGERAEREANAIRLARTLVLDGLAARASRTLLRASGAAVGLPDGQMGNSEVGHLTLGAGQVVMQDLPRISAAIADGSFFTNPALRSVIGAPKIHIIGLTSGGGVHSHVAHGLAVVELLRRAGVGEDRIAWHAILDGRDTPPRAAAGILRDLRAPVATAIGRFYAMDRDHRGERTDRAVELLLNGKGAHTTDLVAAVEDQYARGISDEFIEPIVVDPVQTIAPTDAAIFFNFRADRARQLVRALAPRVAQLVCMTRYDDALELPVAFPPIRPEPTLAQVIARAGLTQLHVAETEKYAHVTYFFNGGVEEPVAGETRVLVPSRRDVPT
jgi:2,3-bisphosphoglycerate-independent phosphoglycerate mutase